MIRPLGCGLLESSGQLEGLGFLGISVQGLFRYGFQSGCTGRFKFTTVEEFTMTSTLEHISQHPRRTSSGKAPVLVLLHGVGGNETNLMPLANAFDNRFHVLSARGPIQLGVNAFGWFEVRFTPDPVINADQAETSRKSLIAFLEEAINRCDLEPSRVYLAGFSQGAIIGASVALTRPDLVAGLVMMSGRILPEIKPLLANAAALETLNVLVAHGTHDGKLPVRHGHASRDLLSSLGVNLTYREYDMGHEIGQDEIQDIAQWLHEDLETPSGQGSA
jgi:phospholipase/carboxylesterase